MAEAAKVRVGVRVRPLLPREVARDAPQVISHPSEKQVLVDNGNGNASPHRFTYDHVFPVHASQRDLYASTAAQMLQPFLDVSLLFFFIRRRQPAAAPAAVASFVLLCTCMM